MNGINNNGNVDDGDNNNDRGKYRCDNGDFLAGICRAIAYELTISAREAINIWHMMS